MRQKMPLAVALFAGLLGLAVPNARADVKPHALFTDNMVLQQGKEVSVWGSADEGERVKVELKTKAGILEASTVAKDGKWLVKLPRSEAGGPYDLTITGKNSVTISNVLVGE